jgi:hypothetical protein
LCREWATRQAFQAQDVFAIHYQYTWTADGTYFCATHVEAGRDPRFGVTVGVPLDYAPLLRGRDSELRSVSRCPEGPCCRRPDDELAARWDGYSWPSARTHSHVLAALPAGGYPGVDVTDVYEFLDRHGVD